MIVALIVLALLLVASEARSVLERRDWTRERQRLLNAALAQTPAEFVALERTTSNAVARPNPPEPAPPLVGLNA